MPVVRPAVVPLSFAQLRLWFLAGLEDTGAAYHIPVAVRVAGPVNAAALEAALGDVAARHESLRTVFPAAGGVPRQQVLDPAAGAPGLTVREVEDGQVAGAVAAAAVAPFDLAAEVPWRAQLLVTGPEQACWWWWCITSPPMAGRCRCWAGPVGGVCGAGRGPGASVGGAAGAVRRLCDLAAPAAG